MSILSKLSKLFKGTSSTVRRRRPKHRQSRRRRHAHQ